MNPGGLGCGNAPPAAGENSDADQRQRVPSWTPRAHPSSIALGPAGRRCLPANAATLRESSPGTAPVRQNRGVRVDRSRENVFTVTATGQELSALVAGARLALDAMRASPDAPATAIELLGRVLDDFDRSRKRLSETPPDGDRR